MYITIAISPIIKALVLDRDEGALVMCHKIHRVVRAVQTNPQQLYSTSSACAPGVVVKHGVPSDGARTAVLRLSLVFFTI